MMTSINAPAPFPAPMSTSVQPAGMQEAAEAGHAARMPSIVDTLYRDMAASRAEAGEWLDLLAKGGEGMTPGRLLVATYKLGSMGVKMAAITSVAGSAKTCLNELKQGG